MASLDELNQRVAQAQLDCDLIQAECDELMAALEARRKEAGLALERAIKEFYDAADATRIFERTRLEHDRVTDPR